MSAPKSILIFHASAGEGHRHAALALQDAFLHLGALAEVRNVLEIGPRWYRSWVQGGYEMLVKRSPRLWGFLYRGADGPGLFYGIQTALDVLGLQRLDNVLDQMRPDWVICTHSLPQPRLSRWRVRALGRGHLCRIAVVVTDLHPHRMWVRGDVDRFFVPHEITRDRLEARRPGSAAVTAVTGIPVDPAFAEPVGRSDARLALGMEPDRTYLILASGGIGGGRIAEALAALRRMNAEMPHAKRPLLTVVCGRNAAALEACTAAAQVPGGAIEVCVEGFVPHERMRTMLRAADLLIGKPGGLTMSEALACGTPMLIYKPLLIPGQEEDNARFLLESGAALAARTAPELRETASDLLSSPDRLAAMQQAAHGLGRPRAAFDIARTILNS
jgi:processive 1,2-diacylglycerol beta-glucosyltransferase